MNFQGDTMRREGYQVGARRSAGLFPRMADNVYFGTTTEVIDVALPDRSIRH